MRKLFVMSEDHSRKHRGHEAVNLAKSLRQAGQRGISVFVESTMDNCADEATRLHFGDILDSETRQGERPSVRIMTTEKKSLFFAALALGLCHSIALICNDRTTAPGNINPEILKSLEYSLSLVNHSMRSVSDEQQLRKSYRELTEKNIWPLCANTTKLLKSIAQYLRNIRIYDPQEVSATCTAIRLQFSEMMELDIPVPETAPKPSAVISKALALDSLDAFSESINVANEQFRHLRELYLAYVVIIDEFETGILNIGFNHADENSNLMRLVRNADIELEFK